ncbi:50S ribosomal protein L11 methyltransferase [Neisseria gonorrhoeae]|uniref:50S ribosomal protein L11 methyltransferase n=1 Tax=Neisseria gonorrhoeae TaxID=485 RepID=A0A378W099_NEIGO|nr:50S ribosomal protein L11 methyltransferase [Neisseria gonorrhoeae]
MPYQQITVNVNDAVAERLADALMEHGALSAAIEDACAGTQNEQAIFGEPGMPTEQIWQQSKVIALFGEHDEAAAVIDAAAQECGLKDLAYTGETIEDQDWVRLTQSQFDPIRISDRLWITPLGTKPPKAAPSTSASIPDSPSAPAATRPRASASNGWIRNSKRRKRPRLRLRFGHPDHRRPQTRCRFRRRRGY